MSTRLQYLIVFILLLTGSITLTAQSLPDTLLSSDSLPLVAEKEDFPKKPKFFKRLFNDRYYPNPKRAVLYAVILPGTGQIYNKQYWKLPIVYGAYGFAVYNFIQKRKNVKFYEQALKAELDTFPETINNTPYNANALIGLRNNARTDAETGFLLIVLAHILQTSDAFVSAHLKTFDVSDDLSLTIKPTFNMAENLSITPGVHVSLNVRPPEGSLILHHFFD